LGGCPKVRPAFQALHGADFWVAAFRVDWGPAIGESPLPH
jgi:hypothetical protein